MGEKWNCIPEFLLWQVHRHGFWKSMECLTFLTLWPWPLSYDIDLITSPRYPSAWPPYPNSSLYVCLFCHNSETDGWTHTQSHTDDVKTITPDISQMCCVMRLHHSLSQCSMELENNIPNRILIISWSSLSEQQEVKVVWYSKGPKWAISCLMLVFSNGKSNSHRNSWS